MLLLSLLACGPTPESFQAEYADGYCALMFECYDAETLAVLGYESEADCISQMAPADTGDIEFDRKAARSCLEAIPDVTCDDLANQTYPTVCAEVY